MQKAKGDMFPGCYTHNYVKYRCPNECIFCYMRHGRLAEIYEYNKLREPTLYGMQHRFPASGKVFFIGTATEMWNELVPHEMIRTILKRIVYGELPKGAWILFMSKEPMGYAEHYDYLPKRVILGLSLETDLENLWHDDIQLKDGTTVPFSKAPVPGARWRVMEMLRQKVDKDGSGKKLLLNMEPAVQFSFAGMMDVLNAVRPDYFSVGGDSTGVLKKNGIAQADPWHMVDFLHHVGEHGDKVAGRVFIKRNIVNLAKRKDRDQMWRYLHNIAVEHDMVFQGDPTFRDVPFFVEEESNAEAEQGDLFGS